jgi:RecB family exonuclease
MEPKSSPENWRDLARQVETEDDPAKMINLIEKLLATYDAEKMRGEVPAHQKQGNVHFPDSEKP